MRGQGRTLGGVHLSRDLSRVGEQSGHQEASAWPRKEETCVLCSENESGAGRTPRGQVGPESERVRAEGSPVFRLERVDGAGQTA